MNADRRPASTPWCRPRHCRAAHPAAPRHNILGAIDRGRVDQVDPEVERLTDDPDRVIRRLTGAEAEPAEPAAAQSGDTDPQAGAAKCGVLHARAPDMVRSNSSRAGPMARTVDIQGHRGARALFPENTLEGFLAAANLGVAAFELDVGMTGDGVVVVAHDPLLNPDIARDASGAWLTQAGPAIRSLTCAQFNATTSAAFARIAHRRPVSRSAATRRRPHPHPGRVLAALPTASFTIEVKTDPATRTGRPPPRPSPTPSWRSSTRPTPSPRHGRSLRLARSTPNPPRPPGYPAGLADPARNGPRLRLMVGRPTPAASCRTVAAEGGPVWTPDQPLTRAEIERPTPRSASCPGRSIGQPTCGG